jgi:hypothetical protein
LFPQAAAVLVHFREEAAGSRAQADDFRALAVDSPVEAADFLARADVTLGPAADFHAPVADSLERADDSRAPAVDSRGQVADSLASAVDFLGLVAASWQVGALACSPKVHCFAPAADSRAQAAGSPERVDEPEVELLVPAADFRAWAVALADSAEAHSLVRAVDFREPAAPSGSLELARCRALAVDCFVPPVSQVVPRSAYSAVLPVASLLRAAVDDWLAVLQPCLRVALEQASRSP